MTVVCWLMGSAADSPDVHGPRLRSLMEHLVDTPVRGLVYEAAGSADAALLAEGASIVREASQTWHMPVEIVDTDPAAHEAWLEAMKAAVERLLELLTAVAAAGARGGRPGRRPRSGRSRRP